ncbi:putative spindle-pole body protein [Talaromyces proteolyticus]|uniref:Spindle-pole body protein n=1 Tax=Talaromyces proteolyticus TaxID=1131652 RepID=A0AAD4PXQ9_9EURO|nr:putative spindle-pole body protein [Talaromyces proteolyticus]KAH8693003.1 putative spindle-pole body protein [Talaromyces proteolyticus]
MPLPYIDTPRTEVDGNATYLTNGLRSAYRGNLSALDSVENSFQTPSKDEDIIKTLEGERRVSDKPNLNTPRASSSAARTTRNVLYDRQNLPTAAVPKGEFTPMMRSVTRNNYLRNLSAVKASAAPKTPAYLRQGNRSNGNTPGLPQIDTTDLFDEGATSSLAVHDVTPLPQVASSSPQSTPLPYLSRSGNGLLSENDQNMLSLKEQENAIDRLDKENFGLKLKIFYLREQLEKAGPAYNQAALKENTELKVLKVTLQREIARYRKNLVHAERDLEAYRRQLQELREKAKRRQAEESVQREMDWMREEIATRETQVASLREELQNAKENESDELGRLRDEIEDLEATLREKDRIIDEKDDAIDHLKESNSKDDDAVGDLEAELERVKQNLEELQGDLDQAKANAQEASQSQRVALQEKEKAEENLKELQEEMANKSFSTKGLSRQLEERTSELEEEIRNLRQEHHELKEDYAAKERREEVLEGQLQEVQEEHVTELEALREESDNAERQSQQWRTERDEALSRLQVVLDDLDRKAEEKELLQTRHNTLTEESASLQRELANAQSLIRRLEQDIDDEKQRGLDNNHDLRAQQKEEVERLQEEIESLQQEIEDKEGQFALEQDRWESERRTLQWQKERSEKEATGYKQTVEKLQDIDVTASGREAKLQEVIDSEKDRHLQEEAVLSRQVKELNEDAASKRQTINDLRNELLKTREDLRVSRREEEALKEKIKALEDEVAIVQASLREEKEYSKGRALTNASDQGGQLQKVLSERQTLRDQLANANVELHSLRVSTKELEAERDILQKEIDRIGSKASGSLPFDQEKIDLRKAKLRLENELQRLGYEKTTLQDARNSLETELNAELERSTAEERRLSNEIHQLQDKLHMISGSRDRELAQAKSKVQSLERRILDLENMLEKQEPIHVDVSTVGVDISVLRQNLEEARKKEKTLTERETHHRKTTRELKKRISELEQELHEAQLKKLDVRSPEKSPSGKLQEELRSLRKKLTDAHKNVNELQLRNRELERGVIGEEDRKDLHELLKSSTLEAESLALKLSERDARVSELKASLRRIREERASAFKEVDRANHECQALQDRYDQLVEDQAGRADNKGRHEKELRGLGKEIIWLKARLKREEKFRKDLAWSKGLMELGERIRVACNEADLRMIAQMGIKAPESSKLHDARRKLRTAGLMVVATIRMQRMTQEWRWARKVGEGLHRAKNELIRKRDNQKSAKRK